MGDISVREDSVSLVRSSRTKAEWGREREKAEKREKDPRRVDHLCGASPDLRSAHPQSSPQKMQVYSMREHSTNVKAVLPPIPRRCSRKESRKGAARCARLSRRRISRCGRRSRGVVRSHRETHAKSGDFRPGIGVLQGERRSHRPRESATLEGEDSEIGTRVSTSFCCDLRRSGRLTSEVPHAIRGSRGGLITGSAVST